MRRTAAQSSATTAAHAGGGGKAKAKRSRRINGEGTIFKDRTRGTWIGELFVDGKRYRRRGKTQVDVVAQLAKLRRHGEDGTAASDGNATVQQVLDLWLERSLPNRNL